MHAHPIISPRVCVTPHQAAEMTSLTPPPFGPKGVIRLTLSLTAATPSGGVVAAPPLSLPLAGTDGNRACEVRPVSALQVRAKLLLISVHPLPPLLYHLPTVVRPRHHRHCCCKAPRHHRPTQVPCAMCGEEGSLSFFDMAVPHFGSAELVSFSCAGWCVSQPPEQCCCCGCCCSCCCCCYCCCCCCWSSLAVNFQRDVESLASRCSPTPWGGSHCVPTWSAQHCTHCRQLGEALCVATDSQL